jgi:hypothetical protein
MERRHVAAGNVRDPRRWPRAHVDNRRRGSGRGDLGLEVGEFLALGVLCADDVDALHRHPSDARKISVCICFETQVSY